MTTSSAPSAPFVRAAATMCAIHLGKGATEWSSPAAFVPETVSLASAMVYPVRANLVALAAAFLSCGLGGTACALPWLSLSLTLGGQSLSIVVSNCCGLPPEPSAEAVVLTHRDTAAPHRSGSRVRWLVVRATQRLRRRPLVPRFRFLQTRQQDSPQLLPLSPWV